MILTELLPRHLFRTSRIALWGQRLDGSLPPPGLPAGLGVARVTARDAQSPRLARLVEAMRPTSLIEIHDRLTSGRRAYVVEAGPDAVAYGWVTLGDERIAEVEGTISVGPGEAYIWDCATLPAWRGRGLYPALLRAIARDLAAQGLEWVWIAARRENRSSLRGFEKAGYVRMADIDYWRLWRWRRLRVRANAGAAAARGRPLRRVVA